MEKKGSITVFLALILSLLLSLVTTGIQSVQAAAARTQILNSMDIGLYSLFGQYDRFLMKEYDLFFIDGAQGNSDLNLWTTFICVITPCIVKSKDFPDDVSPFS